MEVQTTSDLSGLGLSGGQVARLMASNMNPQVLRENGPLQDKEQISIDRTIIQVAQSYLGCVQYFLRRGQNYTLANPLAWMAVQHSRAGDLGAATTAMNPVSRASADAPPNMEAIYTPNPLTFIGFQLDARLVAASRNFGTNLDLNTPRLAARKVGEQIENLAINGSGTSKFAGNQIFGFLNHPDKNSFNFETNLAWDNASKTGEHILADTLSGIKKLEADGFYGPYVMFVNDLYHNALQDDFKTYSSLSIIQRLNQVSGLNPTQGGGGVLRASKMPVNTIVIAQNTPDVIDFVVGDLSGRQQSGEMIDPIPVTTVPWETRGGFDLNFLVLCAIVPRVKSTATNQCGVVVGTPS